MVLENSIALTGTAVLLGLLAVAAVLYRPRIGLYLLVVMLPFNGIITQLLGVGSEATAFGAIKDGLVVLLVGAVLARGLGGFLPFRVLLPIVAILAFALASMLLSDTLIQGLYGFRNDYFPLLLLIAVPPLLSMETIKRLSTLMVGIGQVAGVITIVTWRRGLQWLFDLNILPPPPGERLPYERFSAGSIQPRGFSPYSAPNEAAVATTIVLAVIWCRTDWSLSRRLLLSILPLVTIVLSESRSGWIGAGVVFTIAIARWARRERTGTEQVVVAGAVVVAALAVTWTLTAKTFDTASGLDPSLTGHASSLVDSIPKLFTHPFGFGLGEVGPRAVRYTDTPVLAEGYWLVLGLEAGIIVLAFYVALVWNCARLGLHGRTSTAFMAPLAIAGSLVSQLVLPTLQEGAVCYTLWIVVSFGLYAALRGGEADAGRAAGEVHRRGGGERTVDAVDVEANRLARRDGAEA